MRRLLSTGLCALFLSALPTFADPPAELDYQGKVLINDIPFAGPGYFKFALSDAGGTTNLWSNDGTATGAPVAGITNAVVNGVFSVVLGQNPPMTAINPDIFSRGIALYLRVWFSSDNTTFNEMTPAQKLESSPYAINADQTDGMDAQEIIAAATNGVTLDGDVSGTCGGGTTVDSLQGDALNVGTPSSGDALVWNGAAWSNAPGGMSSVAASNSFVKIPGDTMTGKLNINGPKGLEIGTDSNEVIIGRNASAKDQGVGIGRDANGSNYAVAVGYQANAAFAGGSIGAFSDANNDGAAVGYNAKGYTQGAAMGRDANGGTRGVGVGYGAVADNDGAAVGYQARGRDYGAALGRAAVGWSNGAAVGYLANGSASGAAVGHNARAGDFGTAVGRDANGEFSGSALGYSAAAFNRGAAVGYSSIAYSYGVAAGQSAQGWSNGVGIGYGANGALNGVAVGRDARGADVSVAVGAQANGLLDGAAVGYDARAYWGGAAVGYQAYASSNGVAVGRSAAGGAEGVAVGRSANGTYFGTAAGRTALATNYGVAVGALANGSDSGAAVGQFSDGREQGAALGRTANGYNQAVAAGYQAVAYNLGVAVGHGARGETGGAALGKEANGINWGAAVGYGALGYSNGAAVGMSANAYNHGVAIGALATGTSFGVAVGEAALGRNYGAAVGTVADGSTYGGALGYQANGVERGTAVGAQSIGDNYGVGLGHIAYGQYYGIGIGYNSRGGMTNIAVGVEANSRDGSERVSIGHYVTNDVDESARLRGTFYMDGGTALMARANFGTGPWQRMIPLPDLQNVIWVATNGTIAGPGTIDRPYSRPQDGYNAAAAIDTNSVAAVAIAAGTYPGLTMNAGNVHVFGVSRPELASLAVNAPSKFILGKQRVENIVVQGVTIVAADMGYDVKFHNCRFDGSLQINSSRVEVQDCYARGKDGPAVTVGNGSSMISEIAIYNSSMFNKDSANPALLVNESVRFFEVIGCEIANFDPGPGTLAWAAIEDLESAALHPGQPPHLYSHNVIRGPEHMSGPIPAVYDPNATNGPTITFVQNAVWGDVGTKSNSQFFANNIVYGVINNLGTPWGWSQAGVGAGNDPAGNTEHQAVYPQIGLPPGVGRGFPAAWQD